MMNVMVNSTPHPTPVESTDSSFSSEENDSSENSDYDDIYMQLKYIAVNKPGKSGCLNSSVKTENTCNILAVLNYMKIRICFTNCGMYLLLKDSCLFSESLFNFRK